MHIEDTSVFIKSGAEWIRWRGVEVMFRDEAVYLREYKEKCPDCLDGSIRVTHTDFYGIPDGQDLEPCRTCNGTGFVGELTP